MKSLIKVFQTLYFKLFTLLLAIIIPLFVMQFAMFNWSRLAVSQELKHAAATNVVYLRDSFQEQVDFINNQLSFMITNYDIQAFFAGQDHLSRWDYYISLLQIKRLLSTTRYSNSLISEIRFYYPSLRIGLSSESGILPYVATSMDSMQNSFDQQGMWLTNHQGTYLQSYTLPSTNNLTEHPPVYFAQAVLNIGKIEKHLSSFSQYSDRNALLLNHHTSSVVYSDNFKLGSIQETKLFDIIKPNAYENVYFITIHGEQDTYVAAVCYSTQMNISFVQFIPNKILNAIPDRLALFMVYFAIATILLIAMFSYATYRLFTHPINDIIRAFTKAGQGNLAVRINDSYSCIEYNYLANHFNDMIMQINRLIIINYEQKMRLKHAELKQLQAQINPHFLYNSFFLLRHMITSSSNEQAQSFTNYLGHYFQYLAKNSSDTVKLEEEMQHSINYLAIQAMRFSDTFEAQIEEMPGDMKSTIVPRLILQPIIENICEHSIRSVDDHCLVRINFKSDDDHIGFVIVEDNGKSLEKNMINTLQQKINEDVPVNETSGLINIHKRLQLHFGDECGLSFARSELGGLRVQMTFKIGFINEESSISSTADTNYPSHFMA